MAPGPAAASMEISCDLRIIALFYSRNTSCFVLRIGLPRKGGSRGATVSFNSAFRAQRSDLHHILWLLIVMFNVLGAVACGGDDAAGDPYADPYNNQNLNPPPGSGSYPPPNSNYNYTTPPPTTVPPPTTTPPTTQEPPQNYSGPPTSSSYSVVLDSAVVTWSGTWYCRASLLGFLDACDLFVTLSSAGQQGRSSTQNATVFTVGTYVWNGGERLGTLSASDLVSGAKLQLWDADSSSAGDVLLGDCPIPQANSASSSSSVTTTCTHPTDGAQTGSITLRLQGN
jgi:hypothetical protein